MEKNKEVDLISQENNKLKKDLDWYKRTYENRSYIGLQKQIITNKLKSILTALLYSQYCKKKYVLSHLLSYIIKYGFKKNLKSIQLIINRHGIKSISQYKKIILKELLLEEVNYEKKIIDYKINNTEAYNLEQIKSDISSFKILPKISFILPVYNTKAELLTIALNSICNQIYTNWELCIVDDYSTRQEVRKVLNEYRKDKKIKIKFLSKNVGISASSNEAIKMANGEFISLMDHDDELTSDALYWIVKKINETSDADILYTDECKVDEQGQLSDPFYKPDWSPELMYNMMYVGHLTVYRKSLLDKEVGYFNGEFDYSQDYDLMLRATEKARGIYHIKKILYHWRITEGSASQGDKPFARQTNLAALSAAMERRNIKAEIIELSTANRAKIIFDKNTFVSIIIPTDSFDNLKESVESITNNTSYANYEIVAVTNSNLKNNIEKLWLHPKLTFQSYDLPYNFSDKCNQGVKCAKGEIVIIFNDDVRPLHSDWIENTIEFLFVDGVGGVSPKLIYENNTIQYAGMATGVRRLVGTTFHCYHKDSTNYINFPQLVRNVSILSGACLAIKKKTFLEIGGFDSINTPIMGSDVDFSFKILEKGLRNIYTPYASLCHIGHNSLEEFEKKQPILQKDKSDIFLLKNWIKYFSEDPYFTDPMRNLLYHDSPEPFKLYSPTKKIKSGNKGDVLLVSHDLTRSGAPIMLLNVCKILLSKDYFVTVFSPTDGVMREQYQQLGVTVIVDELILRQHDSFTHLAKNFDLVICNTIITWPIIKQLQDIVPTIWWIHEAQLINHFEDNIDFIDTLKKAKNIITVSNYSLSYINKFNKNAIKIFNGFDDIDSIKRRNNNYNKIIFSVVGSIEGRKGQDLLIDSLSYLSLDQLNTIEIWIIGRTLDMEYKKMLIDKIGNNNNIIFKGEKNHEECLQLLQQTDVIVCPSRDDPFPSVIAEGFNLAKLCIISSSTGTSELITDEDNGFIFKSENPKHLAEKISFILNNKDKISSIGINGRKTFEKSLKMEDFEKNWVKVIKGALNTIAVEDKIN